MAAAPWNSQARVKYPHNSPSKLLLQGWRHLVSWRARYETPLSLYRPSVRFPTLTLEVLLNKLFMDNLSVRMVAQPSVRYCTSVLLSCGRGFCVSCPCVFSSVSSVYCYKTYEIITCSWVIQLNLFLSTTYPSPALQYVFYNIYYALLFYIPPSFFPLFTPWSDFSADVDSLRPPPIYNSKDDLLNFYFFMITYLRCSVKQWS